MTEPYYTLRLPYVPPPHASPWHATDKEGPFRFRTVGAWESYDDAIEWAHANLRGGPYTVHVVDEDGNLSVATE